MWYDRSSDIVEIVDAYKEVIGKCERVLQILVTGAGPVTGLDVNEEENLIRICSSVKDYPESTFSIQVPISFLFKKDLTFKDYDQWKVETYKRQKEKEKQEKEDEEFRQYCKLRDKWESRYQRELWEDD